jgi:hypothetical protein
MMTMVISGSDGVTFPDSTNQFSGGAFSFKNRIINGDMRIAQRGTAAVSTDNSYPVDRFVIRAAGTDELVFSASQDSSAPSGFVNSLKVTVSTPETSFTGAEQFLVRQLIEGTNVSDLGWGTSSATTVTFSFWVRSSLTGDFGGALINSGLNQSYPFLYTISTADTWEKKSITIAGATSGTWLTTTGVGISVNFALGIGPDRLGTAGAWNSNNNTGATGMVQLGLTSGATFFITGVQLEVGSVATPFERRPYGTELALCYRYYYKQKAAAQFDTFGAGLCDTTTVCQAITPFPVLMRVSPTALEQSGTAGDYLLRTANTNPTCSAVPTFSIASPFSATYNFTVASGLTAGQAIFARGNNTSAFLAWSAEL